MNMKQFFNKLVVVLMMALATVGYSCSDCDHEPYDDTEIREQIADLYAKLAALENQISANMQAVQQMMAGRTAIKSYEQDKNGNWVLTLTDGKQITVYAEYEPEALPSSLVYVMEVEIDGVPTKVWATMGPDGQLTPIMDGADYIPVVPEEVEMPTIPTIPTLEYKVEDGKIWIKLSNSETWIETGMTDEALDELIGQGGNNSTVAGACGITGSQFNKVKNEYGEEVVVSVTFTLADGSTFTVKVDTDEPFGFGFYYEGTREALETFYLAPGASTDQAFSFRATGLVDFIKEVPEGWALTVNGADGSYSARLTAPTADAITANPSIASGVVKLFGVFEDGKSAVLKLNVTASNPWKDFAVSSKQAVIEVQPGVFGFVYGVMKAADYDAATIEATVNNELASLTAKTVTVWDGLRLEQGIEEIYGSEMEVGVEYVFYTATIEEKQVGWDFVQVVTSDFRTKTVMKQVVEIEQTASTFNSISVSAKLAGFNNYYSVFGPKGWMSTESFVAEQVNMWLNYDMQPDCVYEVANGNYTMSGPIQKLAPVGTDYQISAGTEYELFILPVEEGKTEYAIEDVYVFNFSSVALTAGGTGSASVSIEPDFTMATATITVTGAAMAYYNWYEKANVPSDVTAALLNEYFAVNQFPATVVNSSLTANTEYVLAVLTVSADGKYSEAQTFEFKTSSIDFSTTFTLTATKQEMADPIAAATGVSVKLETAGGTVKNFRYINKPTSQFNSAYPDEMTLAKKMIVDIDYSRQEISPAGLKEGCLVISGLVTGTEYTLAVAAFDAEGNYTAVQKVVYTPTFSGTVIPATDARWEASKPTVTLGAVTPPEYDWSSNYTVEFTVTPAANTKFWASNLLPSTVNREANKALYVISKAVTGMKGVAEAATTTRSFNPTTQKIYVAWQDAEGNYYEPMEYTVPVE